MWAQLKREYLQRLDRRDRDVADQAEFHRMIRQLYREVPINVDAMLKANHGYIARYLALGDEQDAGSV